MFYGTIDLDTEERRAWQAGDYQRAAALALAIDAEEREAEQDQTVEEKEAAYAKRQEAWSEHNDKMRRRLDNLRQLIEEAARVSNRALILERIQEADELIDAADWSK